jgi:hypothetical protein
MSRIEWSNVGRVVGGGGTHRVSCRVSGVTTSKSIKKPMTAIDAEAAIDAQ